MQKKIIIYHSSLCPIGGVETFLYNWCLNLYKYYDITVLYCNGSENQINRLRKIVKLKLYDKNEKYECDIFIRNSVWGEKPNNVISKDNRYLEMRHANYKHLLKQGKLYEQYHKWDKTNEIVGCGEFVSKMSHEALGDNPTTIKNILLPRQQTQKVIRLISCMRIDGQKGWGRMQKMMDMMREANIKFTWDIFTNNPQKCKYEEVHFWKQRYDIWDYLANADYTVLLSDSEGLPYTIQESLQYQVPCIVTDVGGCTELIKDGINGYVVPLDMNFDINKIKNIPKCEPYDNHALEKWLEYLGNGIYEEKEIIKMKYKVKAIRDFTLERFDEIENLKRINESEKDDEGKWLRRRDTFIVSEDLFDYLLKNQAVNLIETIQEEVPVVKNVDKTIKKIHESAKEEVKKEKTKEQWAVTKEEDGNVHVRPVVNDKIIDTPIEKIIKPKETKKKNKKSK